MLRDFAPLIPVLFLALALLAFRWRSHDDRQHRSRIAHLKRWRDTRAEAPLPGDIWLDADGIKIVIGKIGEEITIKEFDGPMMRERRLHHAHWEAFVDDRHLALASRYVAHTFDRMLS